MINIPAGEKGADADATSGFAVGPNVGSKPNSQTRSPAKTAH